MTPYQKLLVACDGSEGSNIAIVHAAILAKKLGTELHAIWVRSRLPHYPETIDWIDEEEQFAQEFFETIKRRLRQVATDQGISIRPGMRVGHPAGEIVQLARELSSDLIVLGNQGHSRLWGELLGHTADRVNQHAPCSVLIVRSQQESAQYRKILIGYDGSPAAEITLRQALSLAKQLGSKTHVLWIHEAQIRRAGTTNDNESFERDWAEHHFSHILRPQIDVASTAAGLRVEPDFRIGNAAQILISEASAGQFRMLALGHRGFSGIWGRLLGGVADRVSHQALCDVLVVRQKET